MHQPFVSTDTDRFSALPSLPNNRLLTSTHQEDFPVPDAITLAYDAESAAINLQARKDSVACLSDKELLGIVFL